MKLKPQLSNSRDLRKNTRIILEKLKDLSYGNKFESILFRYRIAPREGLETDVQVCIKLISDNYECLVSEAIISDAQIIKKYKNLKKALIMLNDRIKSCVEVKKPIKRRYISSVLRLHTNYFNSLDNLALSEVCCPLYQDLRMAAVAVWGNNWHSRKQ